MTKPFVFWVQFAAVMGLFSWSSVGAVAGERPERTIDQLIRQLDSSVPELQPDPALARMISQIDRGELGIDTELDRLFRPPVFSAPKDFHGAEFRRWQDNTGTYEVEGRLAMIYPDKVRLMKSNGRTTTVLMSRLSPYDQAYVRWVAERLLSTPHPDAQTADSRYSSEYPAR